jgi:hypothetical protein
MISRHPKRTDEEISLVINVGVNGLELFEEARDFMAVRSTEGVEHEWFRHGT